MKKSFFLLTCVIGLLSLIGCSKDETYSSSEDTTKSTKIRWYGVNNPTDEPTTRGVADEIKLWNQKTGIPIKFINDPASADMIEKIKTIAAEWENYAGIKFNFVDKSENAAVRIAFDWQGNDYLTWSYTGTDARSVKNQNEPTAVFGGLQYQDDEQFRGDVLRVFGQILGLEYEQRHQEWDFWKSETKLQRYWEDMFDGMNMDWNEIRDHVFTPLSGENAIYPTQTDEIDELSIMAWPYYTRTQTSKPIANYELSDGDKAFIAKLYPKENCSLPTIQEAWVDTGYFEWVTKENSPTIWKPGMVALKITKLGLKQEYLPDVNDGQQLTSAHRMFSFYKPLFSHGDTLYLITSNNSLKKAPFFNTSNITDFSHMFDRCDSLSFVPLLNTSKGTNFSNMFWDCRVLKNIPLFDTSNGIDFSWMLSSCLSLKKIPLLNTSKGINFLGTFSLTSLVTIPPLNTSNGESFASMFEQCLNLKNIPQINTSKGIDFRYMFYKCSSLTSKPNLDLSKAIYKSEMYKGTPFANNPL